MNAFEFAIRFIDFWIALNNTALDRLSKVMTAVTDNHFELKELIRHMEETIKVQIDALKAQASEDAAKSAKTLAELKETIAKLEAAQGDHQAAIDAAVKVAVDSNNAEFSAAMTEVKTTWDTVSANLTEADAQVEDVVVIPPVEPPVE
jgi:beta-phosphoglucomutase-like phosphatase (HAD superfamily)